MTQTNVQQPPRPELGKCYTTPILKVPVQVLAIAKHFVVCDQERIYDRDNFARLFMSWNPSS